MELAQRLGVGVVAIANEKRLAAAERRCPKGSAATEHHFEKLVVLGRFAFHLEG